LELCRLVLLWSLDVGIWNFLMAYLDQFLKVIVDQGGSDLHIGEGQPPKMRKHGGFGNSSKNAAISIWPTRWIDIHDSAAIS